MLVYHLVKPCQPRALAPMGHRLWLNRAQSSFLQSGWGYDILRAT
jgi:hypothetical protein